MNYSEAVYEQCVVTKPNGERCQHDVYNPPFPYGQWQGWLAICHIHRAQIERHWAYAKQQLWRDYERQREP